VVYLIEAYRSGPPTRSHDVGQIEAAARSWGVRLIARLAVPADEIEFWLFDAASRDDLTTALAAAGIGGNRISSVEDLLLRPVSDFDPKAGAVIPEVGRRDRRE
jgi:hypothetical protein